MAPAAWIGIVNSLLILMGGYILHDIRARIMRLEDFKMSHKDRKEGT